MPKTKGARRTQAALAARRAAHLARSPGRCLGHSRCPREGLEDVHGHSIVPPFPPPVPRSCDDGALDMRMRACGRRKGNADPVDGLLGVDTAWRFSSLEGGGRWDVGDQVVGRGGTPGFSDDPPSRRRPGGAKGRGWRVGEVGRLGGQGGTKGEGRAEGDEEDQLPRLV